MTRDEPFEPDRVAPANDHPEQGISLSQALLEPRIVIENTQPLLDGGLFAVKAVVGEKIQVSSKVYTDGHDTLAVVLNWHQAQSRRLHCVEMACAGNDLWQAEFTVTELGRHLFSIEAWIDPFATYCHDLEKKFSAGVSVTLELQEGLLLLEHNIERSDGVLREQLQGLRQHLPALGEPEQVALLLDADTALLMREADYRTFLSHSPEYPLDVERQQALFASWYELFPRSATDDPERHGTFNDVQDRLPMIRDMGFDVLYFPPIHPIGKQHRKGRNNA
ncbi:MAG: maltotransferase domain-containing protein, partial [Pseudomonas sp.]